MLPYRCGRVRVFSEYDPVKELRQIEQPCAGARSTEQFVELMPQAESAGDVEAVSLRFGNAEMSAVIRSQAPPGHTKGHRNDKQ